MSKDKKTESSEFAREFIENSDIYILERRRMYSILKSFYDHFIRNKQDLTAKPKVLDLGGGDGALLADLISHDEEIEVTLVDGSAEMLAAAKKRLVDVSGVTYVKSTFQDIIEEKTLMDDYDLIVSTLAIHHLLMDEKIALFKIIYNHLTAGGAFFNMDVVLPPDETIEAWYLTLWTEWIIEQEKNLQAEDTFQYIPQQFKNNPENIPDPLTKQLNSLSGIGFKNVDCFYKYGIFSIYGGRK